MRASLIVYSRRLGAESTTLKAPKDLNPLWVFLHLSARQALVQRRQTFDTSRILLDLLSEIYCSSLESLAFGTYPILSYICISKRLHQAALYCHSFLSLKLRSLVLSHSFLYPLALTHGAVLS
ncbi:hypothetical protein DL546_005309 [Coniochaeta pulveracea]|uniref:Uncharacterized protein n=1 Tax=Coniochaeta pulveracea TaxID=177199 RepID=A0A420YFP7_9PEZI|nr:hypothetical protein DL546_005309 [Coniochaeta pulveracea]